MATQQHVATSRYSLALTSLVAIAVVVGCGGGSTGSHPGTTVRPTPTVSTPPTETARQYAHADAVQFFERVESSCTDALEVNTVYRDMKIATNPRSSAAATKRATAVLAPAYLAQYRQASNWQPAASVAHGYRSVFLPSYKAVADVAKLAHIRVTDADGSLVILPAATTGRTVDGFHAALRRLIAYDRQHHLKCV